MSHVELSNLSQLWKSHSQSLQHNSRQIFRQMSGFLKFLSDLMTWVKCPYSGCSLPPWKFHQAIGPIYDPYTFLRSPCITNHALISSVFILLFGQTTKYICFYIMGPWDSSMPYWDNCKFLLLCYIWLIVTMVTERFWWPWHWIISSIPVYEINSTR